MNVAAAVFADFTETFLGTPTRLLHELGGESVLNRTLQRIAQIDGAAPCCLVVRPREAELATRALRDSGLASRFELLALDDAPRSRRRLIRAARKWNLSAWRGTPLGTTWFDEFVEPALVLRVLQHTRAEAVLCFDGHQPLVDPRIAERMLAHAASHVEHARFVFTQAPPGLAGLLLRREQALELVQANAPVGALLSYRPEIAQMDPINRDPCLQIDREITQTPARFIPDTTAGTSLVGDALAALGDKADSLALSRFAQQRQRDAAPRLMELEIELTTLDPLAETLLRPRGARVSPRGPAEPDAIERIALEFARLNDEARIVLGGHGDPLLHPHFPAIVKSLRAAGILALAVRTPLVELSDANLEALLAARVDVLEVLLDANSAATYQQVHRRDAFAGVLANIDRIDGLRTARSHPEPILAPSLTRCAATLAEMEAFYDGWLRRTGAAIIRGYSTHCGKLPPDSLLGATPVVREACQRLDSRLMLRADGRAVACAESVGEELLVGDWHQDSLETIWCGAEHARIRAVHKAQGWETLAPCGMCREWFRA